jgi:hypothetical protein
VPALTALHREFDQSLQRAKIDDAFIRYSGKVVKPRSFKIGGVPAAVNRLREISPAFAGTLG